MAQSPPAGPSNAPQVSLVFGAYGGIGSALCALLVARGDTVIAAGRSRERLQELAIRLGIEQVVADATRFEEVEAGVEQVRQHHGRIDAVANCAGSLLLKPAHLTGPEEYAATISTNLGSAFAVVRAAARAMMTTGGAIVLVSSAAARVGLPNHEAIAAAKAGIIGLTLSAAATYAPHGVRVNCVAPGLVRTPLTRGITGNEMALKASTAMHPLQRIGEPADVASAIAWLMDARNPWITGQIVGVDGGLATVRARR